MIATTCIESAWRAHATELHGYLAHRLADVHAAADLLQDIFLKSTRQSVRFCQLDNPRAWLFQVARNALVDHFRLAKSQEELPDDLPVPPGDTSEPVDQLDACLLRNLATLSAEDKNLIEQCDLRDIKQQEFATAYGLSLSAVKSRLLRARQRLRKALTRNCQVRFEESGRVYCHATHHLPS